MRAQIQRERQDLCLPSAEGFLSEARVILCSSVLICANYSNSSPKLGSFNASLSRKTQWKPKIFPRATADAARTRIESESGPLRVAPFNVICPHIHNFRQWLTSNEYQWWSPCPPAEDYRDTLVSNNAGFMSCWKKGTTHLREPWDLQ